MWVGHGRVTPWLAQPSMIDTKAVKVRPELHRARFRSEPDWHTSLHGNVAELALLLVVELRVGALIGVSVELPLHPSAYALLPAGSSCDAPFGVGFLTS